MDLRTLVRLLRDHWVSITMATLLATTTAVVLTMRETPVYASEATLYVSFRGNPNDPTLAYEGGLLSRQAAGSYAELIRTQRVLSAAAAELGATTTTQQLASRVSATVVVDTALLRVKALDITPEGAQLTANAVANSFVAVLPSLEGLPDGRSPTVVVSMVSAASLPSTPVSPRPLRNIGLAALLGLVTGVALAAARQTLDLTVKSAEQASEMTQAPLLGTIPADPSTARNPLSLREDTFVGRAEALRKVGASLRFIDVERRHCVLLVTSPGARDGKSTTACNLALMLARAGRRVILIDADLRRPRVSSYLGLPSGVGLTSVLVGSATLDEARQSWADNLFAVLASGPVPPNPSEMLGSDQMRQLLARLREEYDDVVVDAAPVLPVADATVAAPACDGVIMIARYGKTRRDQLQQAAATIRATQAPIIGVVLNGVPSRSRGGRYYYHHYYRSDAQKQRRGPNHPERPPAMEGAVRA